MLKKLNRIYINSSVYFAFLAFTIIAVITACSIAIYSFHKAVTAETEEFSGELAYSIRNSTDEILDGYLHALETLSISYTMAAENDIRDPLSFQRRAELLDFNHIIPVDKNGWGIGSDGVEYDFKDNERIMEAIKKGERIIVKGINGHSEHSGEDNDFSFGFVVPYTINGKQEGAMIACTSGDWNKESLARTYFDGDYFFHILDSDGNFIYRSSYGKNPDLDPTVAQTMGANMFDDIENQGKILSNTTVENIRKAALNGKEADFAFTFPFDKTVRLAKLIPLQHKGFCIMAVSLDDAAGRQFHLLHKQLIGFCIVVVCMFLTLSAALLYIHSRSKREFFTDLITGGYSRTRFEFQAEELISKAEPCSYSLITFNINKFKLLNDAYGTIEGDRVLKHVHDTILKHLKDKEIVCRSAADDYDILLHTYSRDAIVDQLNEIMEDINSYNGGKKDKYYLTVSAGAYRIDDPTVPIIHIRDRANIAQKFKGNRISQPLFSCGFYTEVELERQRRQTQMTNHMDEALANGEFVAFLQPKVDLDNEKIVGAEALVRWFDPERGRIPPIEFIPLFEENGFVKKIDRYIFEQSCKYIRSWIDRGLEPVPISVNLSYVNLEDDDFIEEYVEIQKKYDIPPELLELEMTESMMFDNLDKVIDVIARIHDAGFSCSMDDFGSGYSSLNLLKNIDVDTLKLDRDFIKSKDADDPKERAVIAAVVKMANDLKIKVLCEGVETKAQLNFLRSTGCQLGQGFYISKPVDIKDFERLAFKIKDK